MDGGMAYDVQFGGRAAASVTAGRLAARCAKEETGQVRHARQATVVAGHAKNPYTSRS
jgi:hypothetical protein